MILMPMFMPGIANLDNFWNLVTNTTSTNYPAGVTTNDALFMYEAWGGQAGAPETGVAPAAPWVVVAHYFNAVQLQPGVWGTSSFRVSMAIATSALSGSLGAYSSASSNTPIVHLFRRNTPLAQTPVLTRLGTTVDKSTTYSQSVDFSGDMPVLYGLAVATTTNATHTVTFNGVTQTQKNGNVVWRSGAGDYPGVIDIQSTSNTSTTHRAFAIR